MLISSTSTEVAFSQNEKDAPTVLFLLSLQKDPRSLKSISIGSNSRDMFYLRKMLPSTVLQKGDRISRSPHSWLSSCAPTNTNSTEINNLILKLFWLRIWLNGHSKVSPSVFPDRKCSRNVYIQRSDDSFLRDF